MSHSATAPPRRANRGRPRRGPFPQNADRYPDVSTPLPAGLSDEEICARFPNHIKGKAVEMAVRKFFALDVYKHIPEDTKRDRNKDLGCIRTWLYIANYYKGQERRKSRAKEEAEESSRVVNYQQWPTGLPGILLSSSPSSFGPVSQGQPLPQPKAGLLPQINYGPLPLLNAQPLIFEMNFLPHQSDEYSPSSHVQQQLTRQRPLGPFPRNANQYPAQNIPIPEGLSDDEICANFPNHLRVEVLRGMRARAFDHKHVYEHMPTDTKRGDMKADLALLRDRFLFRSTRPNNRAIPLTSKGSIGLQHSSYYPNTTGYATGDLQPTPSSYYPNTTGYTTGSLQQTTYPDLDPDESSGRADADAQAAAAGYYPAWLD
jgi:hypothetical protein